MIRALLTTLFLVVASACGNTGRTPATVTLTGRGASSPVLVDGAYTVTLTRADVAFGPAYFCATATASSELCETAVLETLEAHAIDGLDPVTQPLGVLEGFTGDVRTVQLDLGIAFLLSQPMPHALEGSIEGHSVVLEGSATNGMTNVDFRVAIDVVASESGTSAIVGSSSRATVASVGTALEVVVDPRLWVRGLDWAAIAATPHAPGERVVIAEGSVEYDAILRGIAANAPPTFEWTGAE
jgi:hypothetical protein